MASAGLVVEVDPVVVDSSEELDSVASISCSTCSAGERFNTSSAGGEAACCGFGGSEVEVEVADTGGAFG